MGQDGERKSKAGPESRDGRCGARCRQEEEDERRGLTCDWQVRGPFPSFRRAVTAPSSCGCSSDARRSAGQISSCSSVCGCCGDTNTAKEGEKEERDVSVGRRRAARVLMHACSCSQTHRWMKATFTCTHTQGPCQRFQSLSRMNLKHSTAVWVRGGTTLHNWFVCDAQK